MIIMKVLIVDDEEHVREGIKLLGDWDTHHIESIIEAENGEQAIALIREQKPQIVFTDMKMPNMGGIALLEWMKVHTPHTKTIVVTGYDDYHYMRKAIHFGSTDYILKPVDPSILNDTLTRAVNEWHKEENERKQHNNSYQLINEMKPMYRDRKLTQIINNYVLQDAVYEELGFHSNSEYEVAIIRVDEATIQAFGGDRDLAYFSILNVANELLVEKENGVAFRYLSQKGEIVMIFWDHFSEIKQLLNKLHKEIFLAFNVCCPLAKGRHVESVSVLLESYQTAKDALLASNVLADSCVEFYESAGSLKRSSVLLNLMDYNTKIVEGMQIGKIDAFTTIFDEVKSAVKQANYLSLKELLHIEKEYQLLSEHWLKKYEISYNAQSHYEKALAAFFDVKGRFDFDRYMNRKQREIVRFLNIVKRDKQKNNRDIIYEIEQFLQMNYDRDVKLQEIAERFYLSREYISRKFKQEFQENISDYIVKVRMSKAKSLLKNEQLKIYEVANMIGYQDDKYFRKVFKKLEGLTPNEYRQLSV